MYRLRIIIATDSTIAPPPTPMIFFNERSMIARHNKKGDVLLKKKFPHIFLCAQKSKDR